MPGKENSKMPGSDNTSKNQSNSSGEKDEKAETLVRDADEAVTKFASDKSEGSKKNVVSTCLAAGNYLMFEADLPPREKYKPALTRYRRVIELDPKNEEAIANKTQIEEIYKSMGKPIPN